MKIKKNIDQPYSDLAAETENRDHEVAYWLARKMSGEMRTEEILALEAWRQEDPQNDQAYKDHLEAVARLDEVDTELMAASFEEELNVLAKKSKPIWMKYAQIAASITFLFFTVSVLTFIGFINLNSSQNAGQTYLTSYGERKAHQLNDGSVVTLNTNSKMEVRYQKHNRHIDLQQGEGFFSVESDTQRPFIVNTNHGDIIVTGTVFSIRTSPEDALIGVVSGSVDVRLEEYGSIILGPGQMVRIGKGQTNPEIERFDANLHLAWRQGKTRYRNEPLGAVIADLNRYFPKKLAVYDKELASLPVSGEFDINDQDTAITALELIFNLERKETTEGIQLFPQQ